jgi:hypothetical protein
MWDEQPAPAAGVIHVDHPVPESTLSVLLERTIKYAPARRKDVAHDTLRRSLTGKTTEEGEEGARDTAPAIKAEELAAPPVRLFDSRLLQTGWAGTCKRHPSDGWWVFLNRVLLARRGQGSDQLVQGLTIWLTRAT